MQIIESLADIVDAFHDLAVASLEDLTYHQTQDGLVPDRHVFKSTIAAPDDPDWLSYTCEIQDLDGDLFFHTTDICLRIRSITAKRTRDGRRLVTVTWNWEASNGTDS